MKNILITPEGIKTNLKNVKPLEAICEYIWNGFDAGASQIKVYLHTNELGLINMVYRILSLLCVSLLDLGLLEIEEET